MSPHHPRCSTKQQGRLSALLQQPGFPCPPPHSPAGPLLPSHATTHPHLQSPLCSPWACTPPARPCRSFPSVPSHNPPRPSIGKRAPNHLSCLAFHLHVSCQCRQVHFCKSSSSNLPAYLSNLVQPLIPPFVWYRGPAPLPHTCACPPLGIPLTCTQETVYPSQSTFVVGQHDQALLPEHNHLLPPGLGGTRYLRGFPSFPFP